ILQLSLHRLVWPPCPPNWGVLRLNSPRIGGFRGRTQGADVLVQDLSISHGYFSTEPIKHQHVGGNIDPVRRQSGARAGDRHNAYSL
ncbi:MAG: hypothetical protein ACFBSF_16235, partial [Leptolyngbyaceae cyanobacterium]